MNRIRVAVIGAGAFGQQHARVLSRLPNAELVAIADADPARAQSLASQFGAQPLTDYRGLFGRIDAAILAVPTVAHAPLGVDLLRNGIDILVEKPMAPDLAAADELLAAAHEHGRILQVGHLE